MYASLYHLRLDSLYLVSLIYLDPYSDDLEMSQISFIVQYYPTYTLD